MHPLAAWRWACWRLKSAKFGAMRLEQWRRWRAQYRLPGSHGNGHGNRVWIPQQRADTTHRASSSSAPTARSSASRTARPSPSSSSARTRAASPGPCCAGDRGGRVSLRYGWPPRQYLDSLGARIAYTVLQEQAKTRRRRQVKSQRAVVGASLDVIKERRSQRPEARAAARSQATTAAKEKRAAAQSVKKAEKAKTASKAAAGQTTGR